MQKVIVMERPIKFTVPLKKKEQKCCKIHTETMNGIRHLKKKLVMGRAWAEPSPGRAMGQVPAQTLDMTRHCKNDVLHA